MNKFVKIILALVVIGIIVVIGALLTMPYRSYDVKQFANETESERKDSIKRGEYVALTSDCVACHQTKDRKEDLSGGFAVETPFGTLYSSNITPDKETGIGNWTEQQFADAVLNGKGPNGPLYPAMPYTSYVKMTDQDIHDLWNYLQTVTPVKNKVVENQLAFPFNIRYLMLGWKRLFFDASQLQNDTGKSAQWNRGRYLVEGAAHCSMCHTPRNPFGAEIKSKNYTGANLQNWFAPSLRNSKVHGLGNWSEEDIVSYLKTGSNRLTVASGPMAEAINASFQYFHDDDLVAMANYVKSLPDHSVEKPKPVDAANPQMINGKKVFIDNCIACHVINGEGISSMIPAFKDNGTIQGQSSESMTHILLNGSQGAITRFNPTGAAMPGFAWKLTDTQIADVLTYIRNEWGNAAQAVSPKEVKEMRKTLGAPAPIGE
jgi:Cytochrome c, mono- and diheme variants